MGHDEPIARPPTPGERLRDRSFRALTFAFAWLTIGLVVLVVWQIASAARPAIQEYGWEPIISTDWDGKKHFGFLPEIGGTLYSSILGVAIGGLFGVAAAIFLTQDFLPPRAAQLLRNVVELLAAIPSVVYGLWGIFVVIPAIRPACDWLTANKIEDLMHELERKYTIAIVTHNLQQALRVADKTGFLYVDTSPGGRTGYLVEFGDTAQIFNDPKEQHTKDYIKGAFS